MNIKPQKEKILEELNIKQSYTVYAIATVIALMVTIFFSMQERMIITLVVAVVVSTVNLRTIIKRLRKAKERITDITESEINIVSKKISEGYLYVHQTTKDTYEVCDIQIPEIKSIIEDEKTRAFYIKLREDKKYSKIIIDENIVDANIFKVNGEQYDYESFCKIYEMLKEEAEVEVIGADKKKWEEENKKKELIKLCVPYAALVVVGILHIVLGNF